MTTYAHDAVPAPAPGDPPPRAADGRPLTTWGQDAIAAFFGSVMILGMFLDGRSHRISNVEDASIFNPWHAMLYAGFLSTSIWVLKLSYRKGGLRRSTIPAGYGLALLGAPMFLLSGASDLVWHTFFGFESALESAMSPPHLGLFLSGMILITGPIRAAYARSDGRRTTFVALLPGIVAFGFAVAAIIGWFSVFLIPLPWGEVEGPMASLMAEHADKVTAELDSSLFAKQMLAAVLIAFAALYIVRRWHPPFGTFTLLLAITGLMHYLEDDWQVPSVLWACLAGGLVTDVVVLLAGEGTERRDRYLVATVLPLAIWSVYFIAIGQTTGLRWSHQMWSGCILLAGIMGAALATLSDPVEPDRPDRSDAPSDAPEAERTARLP